MKFEFSRQIFEKRHDEANFAILGMRLKTDLHLPKGKSDSGGSGDVNVSCFLLRTNVCPHFLAFLLV
jgi:hypothetical protein